MKRNGNLFQKSFMALLLAGAVLFGGMYATRAEGETATHTPATDLLIVCAHPGDEFLYLGGLLSIYAGEQERSVTVIYLTGDESRQELALTALQTVSDSVEPIFAGFPDKYTETMENAEKFCDKTEVVRFLTEQIRRLRPAVVVTHEPEGEYGHGMHQMTSDCVQKACAAAANELRDRESAEAYGCYAPLRVFLHLSANAPVQIDRGVELSRFGGRTALEVDRAAYEIYAEADGYVLDPNDERPYARADYGLVESRDPAPADLHGDLFYGIDPALLGAACTPAPEARLTATPLPEEAPSPTDDPWAAYFRSETDPEEVIVVDTENGHWEYRSDTLSVLIDRVHTQQAGGGPVCYQIAHIRMRKENAFRAGLRSDCLSIGKKVMPWQMARHYKAVLAITGDNIDRAETELKGILMRNGQVYSDNQAQDTMALYPDMTMRIHMPNTITPEELLADGVLDTYSFGPTLLRDGAYDRTGKRTRLGIMNPRCGLGYVEPGYFIAITVDGRQSGYSRGVSLKQFAHLFYINGCTLAYNLDGGSSTAMVFMGEYLTQHSGTGSDVLRAWADGLLCGESDAVPSVNDPLLFSGDAP